MDDNERKVFAYLLQHPKDATLLGMNYIPTIQQNLHDAANNLDFGKVSAMQRALGFGVTPNTRVSEDFGALQAMRRGY